MKNWIDFFKFGIWRLQAKKLDKKKYFLITQLRIILIALRSFRDDKCILRASALTFYTLLSIVPVVAVAFGIAKGFKVEKLLERQLIQNFEGQEEVFYKIVEYSKNLLENTNGGLVAGFGVIMLLWTVIKLLENIENSFNDIWGVKEGRTIGRKFSDYFAIILICPILLAIAGSTTVFIASYLEELINSFGFFGFGYVCFNISIRSLPFFVTWLLFLFLYIFIPNTKVNSKAAIFASFIAGIFYQLLQFGYVNCQFALSKTNTIYGSLAALPFFLVWVQSSWLIVFFGAEIAFAIQNVEAYEFEPDCLSASPLLKFAVTLIILSRIVNDFEKGKQAPDENILSHDLEIPVRMVKDIVFECKRASLIVQTESLNSSIKGYHPAYDSAKFTLSFIIEKFMNNGTGSISNIKNDRIETAKAILYKLFTKLKDTNEDIHIRCFSSSNLS